MRKFFSKIEREIWIIFLLPLIFFYKVLFYPQKIIYPAYDLLSEYYPLKLFFINNLFNQHVLSLWNPLMFSGITYIGDPGGASIFSPFTLLYLMLPVHFAFGINFLLNTIIAGIFTYLFSRQIKISKFASLITAIVFMFGGPFFMKILPGHIFISDSIALFPLILYLTEKAIQTRRLIFSAFSGIPLAIVLATGNIQIGLYEFLAVIIYFILRVFIMKGLIKDKKILFAPFIMLMIGISFLSVEFFPILEFSQFSGRIEGTSYLFSADFSLSLKQAVSFILPQFFGTPLNNSYWGLGNFWELCGYLGIVPLFFAFFSLFKRRNSYVLIFLILGLFSFLFALGKYGPIYPFFYKFMPFFASFRVPTRFLFVYGFSVSILTGFGLDAFLRTKRRQKNIYSYLLIIFGFLLLIGVNLVSYLPNKINLLNQFILRNTYALNVNKETVLNNIVLDISVLSIALIGLGTIIFSRKYQQNILKALTLIIITANLWFYWFNYYDTRSLNTVFKKIDVVEQVKMDKSLFRVFDLSGLLQKDLAYAGVESATGLGPRITNDYRKFIWQAGDHLDKKQDTYIDIVNLKNVNILRKLNVKYVISKTELKNPELKKISKGEEYYLYSLSNTFPRLFLTQNNNLNATKQFKKVNLVTRSTDKLETEDFYSEKATLVLSQPFYPGWKAYDNGKLVKIYKVDDILTGIKLEKGSHKLVFKYEPDSYKYGIYLSLLTIFVLVIIVYKKRKP
ncbi:MAG: hypothetical protein A2152_01000 [Candidatus Levybacteria bacterium RBG_16_35_6]|nr:MAG: hypothetical protein A2152_01000 [Candidatus Levybacteria bacterium RBG_16_35_6]